MRVSLFLVLLVATFAASCFNLASAKEEVQINTKTAELWKTPLAKAKAVAAFKAAGKLRGDRIVDKWFDVIAKVQVGAKLKPLDRTRNEWQSAVAKLKGTGQLKNVNEAQAAKIAEGVAQEIVKNPSRWLNIKKTLILTLGVGISALIFTGIILIGVFV